jgi:hypothetical protein
MTSLHQPLDLGMNDYVSNKINFTGNIIPHSWYHKIINSRGQPDSNAIIILAEIVYWYRAAKNGNSHKFHGNSLQLGYDHLINKLNFTRDQIRNALKKLEELNLVYRTFKTEVKFGSNYSNIMFLELNIEALQTVTSCSLTKKAETKNNGLCSERKLYNDVLNSPPISKFTTPSLEISEDNKEYKENNKNRYLDESNFSNFSSKIITGDSLKNINSNFNSEKGRDSEEVSVNTSLNKKSISLKGLIEKATSIKQSFHQLSFQPIDSYLPLTDNDEHVLCKRVGREFGLTFINALARKLSAKYSGHRFKDKDTFINYLAKALEHEMHSPEKVNNINFAYLTSDEKYLEKVESSNETCDIMKIKKRIAQEFDPNLAVKILKKCYFPNLTKESKNYNVFINDNSFSLKEKEQEKLIKIIQEISKRYDLSTGEYFEINKVRIVRAKEYKESKASSETISNPCQEEENQDPIWQRVRERLKTRFSPETDKSWFRKVAFTYEPSEGKVILGFESKFMSDYFEANFGSIVYRYLQDELKSLCEVVHQIKGSNELITVLLREKSIYQKPSDEKSALFHNVMAGLSINQNVLCSV